MLLLLPKPLVCGMSCPKCHRPLLYKDTDTTVTCNCGHVSKAYFTHKSVEKIETHERECMICHKGTFREMSIYDDWDCKNTCDNCGFRIKARISNDEIDRLIEEFCYG